MATAAELRERTRGLGVLLRDLASGSADLMRGEVRLARLEIATLTATTARGVALVTLGAVLLVLGGLAAATGVVLLVGDQWLPRDRYWVAGALVMIVTALLAGWAAMRGLRRLQPARLAPNETVETLREDREWLKQRLTSGATSS